LQELQDVFTKENLKGILYETQFNERVQHNMMITTISYVYESKQQKQIYSINK